MKEERCFLGFFLCTIGKPLVCCQGTAHLENEISILPYVPKVLILHHLLFSDRDTLHAEN